MLEKERSRPKVTHIPPLVGSVGLNSVSPRRRVPAEPRSSASAHNVKYNEGRGGGGVNDDADENDEDKDDDGRLVFPINTSALE